MTDVAEEMVKFDSMSYSVSIRISPVDVKNLRRHLQKIGITTVERLRQRGWNSIKGHLNNPHSPECKTLLSLLHWMASNNVRFKDFDPQAQFPTLLKECGLPTAIHNALFRIPARRLEMLCFFTGEDIRQLTRSVIAAGGLLIVRKTLAKRGLHLKGEG